MKTTTWDDVDTGCQLVWHEAPRNLLRLVAVGGRHEGHGELLHGAPGGHGGHREEAGYSTGQEGSQDAWHKDNREHSYLPRKVHVEWEWVWKEPFKTVLKFWYS